MKIALWFATPIYSHKLTGDIATSIQSELNAVIEKEYDEILTRNDAKNRSYTQARDLSH